MQWPHDKWSDIHIAHNSAMLRTSRSTYGDDDVGGAHCVLCFVLLVLCVMKFVSSSPSFIVVVVVIIEMMRLFRTNITHILYKPSSSYALNSMQRTYNIIYYTRSSSLRTPESLSVKIEIHARMRWALGRTT